MKKDLTILQKGIIYFLYRPKIQTTHVESLQDVQRLYLILKPVDDSKYIKIISAKKQLPYEQDTPHFAVVDLVTSDKNELNKNIGEEVYYTNTRGKRVQAKVRILGEGKYLIVLHKKHTHLVYQLVEPQVLKKPQKSVKITTEGSLIITVKNPVIKTKNLGLTAKKKVVFPEKLQNKFNNKKFIPVTSPDFLKYEGTEILLIGQTTEKVKEITKYFKQELVHLQLKEIREIFNHLHDDITIMPIFKGKWI